MITVLKILGGITQLVLAYFDFVIAYDISGPYMSALYMLLGVLLGICGMYNIEHALD